MQNIDTETYDNFMYGVKRKRHETNEEREQRRRKEEINRKKGKQVQLKLMIGIAVFIAFGVYKYSKLKD